MKKETGITLIALIITIIILVILAAVSINSVYNMGVVNHAINGTTEYTKAAKNENDIMDSTESFIENSITKIKNTNNNSLISKEVTITVEEDIISFIPKENETWYQWATDPEDSNDTGEIRAFGNLTLKQLIIKVYNDGSEEISGYLLFGDGSLIQGQLVSNTNYPICENWNSIIKSGESYYANIFYT